MDRRRRDALAVVFLLLVAALGIQAATAAPPTPDAGMNGGETGAYPGKTLITVQSFGWFDNNNGQAIILDKSGEVVWRFDPPNSRVFDAERLENGNILASVATALPASKCPEKYAQKGCVQNRVVEVDHDTKEIVWEYAWKDAFIHWHEVHDADRLPTGETAIIDMGNNRAFTVNEQGNVTWQWSAEKHISEGTAFWEKYVPEDEAKEFRRKGPESDWTHMNDIDYLENGHFQLSIRNFDVVIEVDPATNRIVDVIGSPGETRIMNDQHNPNRIGGLNGTLLVADSKNNRIVEIALPSGQPIWSYSGSGTKLSWPRDADRLPNGNTLIVDSRNFRVLEINETGEVVWSYSLQGKRGIVYDADRLGLPEEPDDVPTAESFGDTGDVGSGSGLITVIESWAGFVFPPWVAFPELLTIAAMIVVALALAVDTGLRYWRRRGTSDADGAGAG